MEEFLVRFPGLGEKIFDQLDNQNLAKCKVVSRSQCKFLDENKLVWKRMIEKYSANNVEFKDFWKLLTEKVPAQIVKELALAVEKFYTFRSHRLEHQHSPHHIAAERGILSLCKFIAQKTKVLNPTRADGLTGLHFAAQEGHFDVCQYLIGTLDDSEDKNPKDKDGRTPLQLAGMNGHFEIFKLIMANQSEKNPKFGCCGRTLLHGVAGAGHLDVFEHIALGLEYLNPPSDSGKTPLHEAAQEGKLEVVKYIVDKIIDKNPNFNYGWTPLHMAAQEGHINVFEYLANVVSDLNLTMDEGSTSLHLAASKGHFEIVRYIVGTVNVKNPANDDGNTPLHEAAKKGHLEIYKFIADQVDSKNPFGLCRHTPLHDAVENGHIEIVKYIMNVVSDKNPEDHEGLVPLCHCHCLNKNYEMFEVLIDLGADPNPTTHQRCSALDLPSAKQIRDLFRKNSKKIKLSKKRKL